eukprot:573544-Pyramimonas_sp.AAC.1
MTYTSANRFLPLRHTTYDVNQSPEIELTRSGVFVGTGRIRRSWRIRSGGSHYLSASEPTTVPKIMEDPKPAMNSLPMSPLS